VWQQLTSLAVRNSLRGLPNIALTLDIFMILDECGVSLTECMHVQNMEQLKAYDCSQNVSEPQATEYH